MYSRRFTSNLNLTRATLSAIDLGIPVLPIATTFANRTRTAFLFTGSYSYTPRWRIGRPSFGQPSRKMSTAALKSRLDVWNPVVYGEKYVDERTRPGLELIQRARHAFLTHEGALDHVKVIYDLGCGTGRFIPDLLGAFTNCEKIVALDTSDSMLIKAKQYVEDVLTKENRANEIGKVSYQKASINAFTKMPGESIDLIYSNAAFQWVKDHDKVFPQMMEQLRSGGVLAVQMPNNFQEPSHISMHDVSAQMVKNGDLAPETLQTLVENQAAVKTAGIQWYYKILQPYANHLDIWDTIYLQTLTEHAHRNPLDKALENTPEGDKGLKLPVHPVASFVYGSSLGVWLTNIPADKKYQFLSNYISSLFPAYPVWKQTAEGGSEEIAAVFPFSRWFIIARRK